MVPVDHELFKQRAFGLARVPGDAPAQARPGKLFTRILAAEQFIDDFLGLPPERFDG